MRRWKKPLLSIFIVYHLYAIVLAPNCNTYLGYKSAPFFESYLNFFEFLATWSFFAPEPGPPPIFVEWESLDKNWISLSKGSLPPKDESFFFRERLNRRIVAARFMAAHDTRAEKMLVPYLCQLDPKTAVVRLWKVGYGTPSFTEVAEKKKSMGDTSEETRKWISDSLCQNT